MRKKYSFIHEAKILSKKVFYYCHLKYISVKSDLLHIIILSCCRLHARKERKRKEKKRKEEKERKEEKKGKKRNETKQKEKKFVRGDKNLAASLTFVP